jgi:hypothetical protein
MEENFKADLDKLIALFKKLREKNIFESMIKDKEQIANIDMVIDNYNMIKDNIPDEVAAQLGKPIKTLILMLTEQLKDEINTEDEVKNGENELEIIDNILTEGNLSDEEINNLLDRRNDLKD